MKLFKFLHLPVFAVSLCIGIFVVYMMSQSEMRKVYVFPTPENDNIIQYQDATNTCFQVKQTPTRCPTNPKEISKIPVQP